jgi:hypothetical protein
MLSKHTDPEVQAWKVACEQVDNLQIGDSLEFLGVNILRCEDGYLATIGDAQEMFDNQYAVHGLLGML